MVTFPNGKKIAAFYKLREDDYGMVFSSYDLLQKDGNIFLPLFVVEDLTSNSPVNGFSWDDEDLEKPNHFIKLEAYNDSRKTI